MTDSGEKNSILSNVEIKGTIRFSKELMFDGTLEGDVASHGGTLVIGGNGKIHGNIQAREKIDIRKQARITGDIKAARIETEDGAYLKGSVDTRR